MRVAKVLVAAVALLAFGVASAQDTVVVHHPNPVGLVARDTVAGAALGAVVGGGVILYNMGIENNSGYNWGRTLALGAGIGAAAGLVWGVVDATTASGAYGARRSIAMAHDGLSPSLSAAADSAPGEVLAPIAMGRF